MLNTILSAWVKIVYRQYKNRFTNSVTSSTTHLPKQTSYSAINVQLPVYRHFITYLNNSFSTTKNTNLYLLNNRYTHNPQDLLLRALKRI